MPIRRESMLEQVRAGGAWDLVVIGGGATGLGTAVDASARGYKTLLIEAHDFAKGTSSRSTKLVHGGVRYLARGDIGLVRTALRERGLLRRNAPHLVRDLAFVIPAYSRWTVPYYGIGLKLYDLLAGRLGLAPSRPISREEALRRAPTLEAKGLRGGVLYHDAQFDDARLAMTLLRTCLDQGATALNYVAATGFLKGRKGQLIGLLARDAETDEEFPIESRAVVNATGVFADSVRLLDDPDQPSIIAPSQGSHLVLDRSFLPGDSAIMVPRTDDGRVLFAIPWHDRVIVGTTDTPVDCVEDEPRPQPTEIEFLLRHAGRYLSRAPVASDIRSIYAGLRPLIGAERRGAKTASLSREHSATVSASGLVTIAGGKWTTYRLMGQMAVDRAAEVAGLPRRPCPTESLKLHGWVEEAGEGPFAPHGSDASAIQQSLAEHPEWGKPLHPDLPYAAIDVIWAVRHELARTVEDVLSRRTRALILDARASEEAAPLVAKLLASELGRDGAWAAEQVRRFCLLAERYQVK